ncbi:MAG TPA: hypothetical protein VEI25_00555 [Paraburkholderia sp.]|nr:hypothetical protein [Paraburkholderia sp.]
MSTIAATSASTSWFAKLRAAVLDALRVRAEVNEIIAQAYLRGLR